MDVKAGFAGTVRMTGGCRHCLKHLTTHELVGHPHRQPYCLKHLTTQRVWWQGVMVMLTAESMAGQRFRLERLNDRVDG
jgi:hypothetical protein